MRKILALLMLLPSLAGAAFHAGSTWEIRTDAADANGGGGFRNVSNLAAPSAPSVSCPTTGGTVAANTYYVVVNYVDADGNEGPASAATTQACTGATSVIDTTSPAASARAVFYRVYMSATNLPGPWWASPGTDVAIGTNSTRTTTPATSGTQPVGQSDYSQQAAAQIAYSDIIIAGTTTQGTSVLNPFTPAMVGNVVNVLSGATCTVQRAQITAVSAANIATFDKSLGTAAGVCSGNLGGALLTLSAAALLNVAGNANYARDGTYLETLTITISGGAGTPIRWFGYDAARGDNPKGDGRPLIDGASTRANCLAVGNTVGNQFHNFRFTGATGANVTQTSAFSIFHDCKSSAAGTDGWEAGSNGQLVLIECESSANAGRGVVVTTSTPTILGSNIHDNGGVGVSITSGARGMIEDSIIETNAGSGILLAAVTGVLIRGNTINGNAGATTDGIQHNGGVTVAVVEMGNIVSNNGRYGVNRTSAGMASAFWDYNAVYGNATAGYNNVTPGAHDSTLDPGFVDAAGGNYAIGANLKGLGFPALFPGGLSTGSPDIGAVQRVEAASGGGLSILSGGILQ